MALGRKLESIDKYTCKLCSYLIILSISLLGCGEGKVVWRLDPEYSMNLTILANNYNGIIGEDIIDTVDAIQVYRLEEKHFNFFDLSGLFSKQLIKEIYDKKAIRQFLTLAQQMTETAQVSYENRDRVILHVVAFDNTLFRAGYFLLNKCTMNGKEYFIVQSLQKDGAKSIYFNESLIPIIAGWEKK